MWVACSGQEGLSQRFTAQRSVDGQTNRLTDGRTGRQVNRPTGRKDRRSAAVSLVAVSIGERVGARLLSERQSVSGPLEASVPHRLWPNGRRGNKPSIAVPFSADSVAFECHR